MKTMIVFDSAYGNTEKVARAVAVAIEGDVRVLRVHDLAGLSAVESGDLLIVGSPTQGGRPTKETMRFIAGIKPGSLRGVRVAAFDTRFAAEDHGVALGLLMKLVGFAAPRILAALTERGGIAIAAPTGFVVQGKQGALRDGETSRAAGWAAGLAERSSAAAAGRRLRPGHHSRNAPLRIGRDVYAEEVRSVRELRQGL